jgi:N-acetylmuramoyl-L-alanine amidase
MMARRVGLVAALMMLAAACSAASGQPAATTEPPLVSLVPLTTTTAPPATTTSSTTSTSTTTTTTTIVPIGVPDPVALGVLAEPGVDSRFDGIGMATVPAGGAAIFAEGGTEQLVVAREGLVFAVTQALEGGWVELVTMCDTTAWARSTDLALTGPSPSQVVGKSFDFSQAVVVLDPGHGGPWNIGAVAETGLKEKEINVDIARRARDLFSAPHTVDWESGTIYTGDQVPAVARVIVTRTGADDLADYEAGLLFRAELANAMNADAFVAIHNNAGHENKLETPGSDVYYQSQLEDSRRFATIMVEEFNRSFAPFGTDWVGVRDVGAKSRLSTKNPGKQYYGVLKRTEMPAVIAEGAFMSNRSEADLLATPEFRQAYAEAVYRAVVRFLTDDAFGDAPSFDPKSWGGFAGSGDARPTCVIPSQGDQ